MKLLLTILMLSAGLQANPQTFAPANGANLDAFARQRFSTPRTIFDSKQLYGLDTFFWSTSVGGSGAASTYSSAAVSTTLTSGTDSGSFAVNQTRTYWPYQPGKSQLAFVTGNFWGTQTNVVKRIGLFDEYNGIFFQVSGTALSAVIRSDVSGVPVDQDFPRSQWSDPLDGTGPSRYNLNLSTSQIFIFDFEWLGVGQVRFGFWADTKPVYVYIKANTNVNPGVYMRKPNLPVRYEIRNVGVAASAPILTHICSSVMSEGGLDLNGLKTGAAFTRSTKSVGAGVFYPMVSVRLRSGFERGASGRPLHMWAQVASVNANGVAGICYNCPVSGGSWVSITGTAFEFNEGVTAMSVTDSAALLMTSTGFNSTGGAYGVVEVPTFLWGNYDYPQTTADIWTLWVYNVAGTNSYLGGMDMEEVR